MVQPKKTQPHRRMPRYRSERVRDAQPEYVVPNILAAL